LAAASPQHVPADSSRAANSIDGAWRLPLTGERVVPVAGAGILTKPLHMAFGGYTMCALENGQSCWPKVTL